MLPECADYLKPVCLQPFDLPVEIADRRDRHNEYKQIVGERGVQKEFNGAVSEKV